MTTQLKKVKVTKMRGEDVKAGQSVGLEDKFVYRVLRNDRDRRGGGGALQLYRKGYGWMWRGYQHHNSFNVVTHTIGNK